jgi:hypothetical protein
MRAVEAHARATGITRSAWLRDAALLRLAQPDSTLSPPLESTILEELMGLRYLVLNLFSRANLGFARETLYDCMSIADRGKGAAAARVHDSPGDNPTP